MIRQGPYTKEEADIARQSAKEGQEAKGFCPMIRGACRLDCVCWVHPFITGTASTHYVQGGYCGNGMFEERPQLSL